MLVLDEHRTHPPAKPDLVTRMLEGVDKETGKRMSDESIKNNVGMVSWLCHSRLMKSFSS